jgi:hypothetical protein
MNMNFKLNRSPKHLKLNICLAVCLSFAFISKAQTRESEPVLKPVIEVDMSAPIEKHDIIVRMEDESGREMKFIITRDEYKKMEARIREYEREHGITDRSKNVYVINPSMELLKVATTTKE